LNWRGKSTLVTGAGGFIGSHLTEALIKEGARVRALVHYNALGKCGWLDESPLKGDAEVFLGDITDRDNLRKVMKGIDIIFHLAALIAIPYSYIAPSSFIRTNIEGTLNILQNARELETDLVLHTSTSEVYGTAVKVPIDENHPLQGQSPYSASKIGADKIAEAFYRSFGLPVVTVRPFNTFGPRQSARAVIPTIIIQGLAGKSKIRLGSLTPTRDMTFVSNTVDAYIAAASKEAIGRTINFGSGQEISIGSLVNLIASLLGRELSVETDSQRVRPEMSEVNRLVADNTLARQLLSWEPLVDLEEGLKRTIAWFKDNLDKYLPDVYSI
jgi:NAD dependent epimerase/dehydratase